MPAGRLDGQEAGRRAEASMYSPHARSLVPSNSLPSFDTLINASPSIYNERDIAPIGTVLRNEWNQEILRRHQEQQMAIHLRQQRQKQMMAEEYRQRHAAEQASRIMAMNEVPPTPPTPVSPTFKARGGPNTVDYIVNHTLPGWPKISLIYYPSGHIHVVREAEGLGMIKATKIPDAGEDIRVSVVSGPEVTQLEFSGREPGVSEFGYASRGGHSLVMLEDVEKRDLPVEKVCEGGFLGGVESEWESVAGVGSGKCAGGVGTPDGSSCGGQEFAAGGFGMYSPTSNSHGFPTSSSNAVHASEISTPTISGTTGSRQCGHGLFLDTASSAGHGFSRHQGDYCNGNLQSCNRTGGQVYSHFQSDHGLFESPDLAVAANILSSQHQVAVDYSDETLLQVDYSGTAALEMESYDNSWSPQEGNKNSNDTTTNTTSTDTYNSNSTTSTATEPGQSLGSVRDEEPPAPPPTPVRNPQPKPPTSSENSFRVKKTPATKRISKSLPKEAMAPGPQPPTRKRAAPKNPRIRATKNSKQSAAVEETQK